jgi:hypothetical protein
LAKIRRDAVTASLRASSGVAWPAAALPNITLRTHVLNISSMAALE